MTLQGLSPAAQAIARQIFGGQLPDEGSYGGTMEGAPPQAGNPAPFGFSPNPSLQLPPGSGMPQTGGQNIMGPRQFTMPGSVPPDGGAPAPGGSDLFGPRIDEAQKDLEERRKRRDEAYQHLMDNHYPSMQEMKWTTKDLLGLLPAVIGLLSGKNGQDFAGGYASSYLGGKKEGVDKLNADALNKFAAGAKKLELGAKLAEQGVDDAQSNISTLFTKQNQELNRLSREDLHDDMIARQKAADAETARYHASEDKRKRITSATIRRDGARTLGSMISANDALKGIDPDFAIPDEQLLLDFQDKQLGNANSPLTQYNKKIENLLTKFGFIPESQEKGLEKMRTEGIRRIAGTDDPEMQARVGAFFMEAPTETTLTREKFGFYKGAERQRLQQAWRRVAVAERQITNAEEALDYRKKEDATRDYNNGIKDMNGSLEAGAKDLEKLGQTIEKMDADVAAAEAALNANLRMDEAYRKDHPNFKGDGKETEKARVALDKVKAKRDSLSGGKTRKQLIDEAKALRAQKAAPKVTELGIDTSGGAKALGGGEKVTKGGNKWKPG